MATNEQSLVARWDAVATTQQQERQLLLRETASYLQHLDSNDHWWCQHTQLTQRFCCVLTRHDKPGQHAVQKLWQRMSEQLSSCAACVVAFHTAMASLLYLCLFSGLHLTLHVICHFRLQAELVYLVACMVT